MLIELSDADARIILILAGSILAGRVIGLIVSVIVWVVAEATDQFRSRP